MKNKKKQSKKIEYKECESCNLDESKEELHAIKRDLRLFNDLFYDGFSYSGIKHAMKLSKFPSNKFIEQNFNYILAGVNPKVRRLCGEEQLLALIGR